jgi:hypothetical protein
VVLGMVLAASALNLILGLAWLVALAVMAMARWRSRLGVALPMLVVVLVAGLAALGVSRGWLEPPPAKSYEDDELVRLRRLWGRAPAPEGQEHAALVARLRALREEERATEPAEIERRAGAAVAFVRDVQRLRARPPAELAVLEAAVRRLAFTLTSPEFRDLDGRRVRAERFLGALEERLRATPDEATLAGVRRALEPTSVAPVTLRAVRDDLRRVDQATWGVIRALGGGEVTAAAATSVAIDDLRAEVAVETRYDFPIGPSTRIVRFDPASARRASVAGSSPGVLRLEVGGQTRGELTGGSDVLLDPGATTLALVVRHVRPLPASTVQAPFRRIAFPSVDVESDRAGGEPDRPLAHVLVGIRPDGWPGAEPLLAVFLPVPEIAQVSSPARSLFWVSAAGGSTSSGAGPDVWRSTGSEPARLPLRVELVPRSRVFRSRVFAALAPHVYRASLATLLGVTGLAALVLVLAGRASGPEPA